MKHLSLVAAALIAVALAGPASASHYNARVLQDARVGKSKPELKAQQSYSTRVVSVLHRSWKVAPRHRTCWSHVPWSKVCDASRRRLRLHHRLLVIAERRLALIEERELLARVGTYLGAVSYVERYFGPQPFLRNCPNGEGGFGEWVYIGHASYAVYGPNNTPGGWLQFMGGTFYGIIDEAIASARARGMTVPDGTRSWRSPLGQALAGRQMLQDGRRGEWTGRNC